MELHSSPEVNNSLRLDRVSKSFGPTVAVHEVSLNLDSTHVVAIVGGNGAGKSTLMKSIAGSIQADSGSLLLNGEQYNDSGFNPARAHKMGIRIVHQELSLCDSLTVSENFYLEQGDAFGGLGWRKKASEAASLALSDAFGGAHQIATSSKVSQLNPGQKQMLEIARAASAPDLKVLILDEPTSALGLEHIDSLSQLVRRLQDMGVVVIFITHKMSELPKLTDRVIVMKEGELVADMPTSETTTDSLLTIMLGGEALEVAEAAASNTTEAPSRPAGAELLTFDQRGSGDSRTSTIHVNSGEVVGLAGLQGAGQEQLLRDIQNRSLSSSMVPSSTAYVTGDRKSEGIFPLWNATKNMTISSIARHSMWRIFRGGTLVEQSAVWFDRLKLSRSQAAKSINQLSGGMQQKVLFARGLAADAELLLLNDPTRGVDLATKTDMYRLIQEASASGKGVLWYSSEESEMAFFDRVYVMSEGSVVEEFTSTEMTFEAIMKAAFANSAKALLGAQEHNHSDGIRGLLSRLAGQPWLIALIGLGLVLGVLQSERGILTNPFGLGLVLTLAPVLALAATSQMFIVAIGHLDLGVGSFMGLIGVIAATSLSDTPPLGFTLIVGATLLYPLLAWFIRLREFPALVATLAMSFVYTGLALTILPNVGGQTPEWLSGLTHTSTPLLPFPIWLLIIIGSSAYLIIARTRLGTRIRAMGSNPRALEESGWSLTGVQISVYLLAGVTAALAGLYFSAIATSGDANATSSYTLITIAAIVIGGCQFLGGKVSAVGVVLAAVLLSLVGVLLGVLAVPALFTAAATGVLLVFVMSIRRLVTRKRSEES